MFYKAIVQSVLLYGSETWTIRPAMLKVLESFHNRVARRLTGRLPYRSPAGQWEHPSLEGALEEAGMYPMSHYLGERRNRLVDHVATRPVFDLCVGAGRRSGSVRRMRWWNQVERDAE